MKLIDIKVNYDSMKQAYKSLPFKPGIQIYSSRFIEWLIERIKLRLLLVGIVGSIGLISSYFIIGWSVCQDLSSFGKFVHCMSMSFDQFTASFTLYDMRCLLAVLELQHVTDQLQNGNESIIVAQYLIHYTEPSIAHKLAIKKCIYAYIGLLPFVSITFILISAGIVFRAPILIFIFNSSFVLGNPCFIAIVHLGGWVITGNFSDDSIIYVSMQLDQLIKGIEPVIQTATQGVNRNYSI